MSYCILKGLNFAGVGLHGNETVVKWDCLIPKPWSGNETVVKWDCLIPKPWSGNETSSQTQFACVL